MLRITNKIKGASIIALAAFFTTLFSFTVKPGGEGFEIYLNNKLMVQQYGSQMDAVKNLQLDQRVANDQLTIKYHHCGKIGKNRMITIKDGQNRILKEWHFANAPGADASITCDPNMNFNVKDILALQKGNNSQLKLYYSSAELPQGRLLATIIIGATVTTKP